MIRVSTATAVLAIALGLPQARAAQFALLHSFNGSEGREPVGALAVDAAGNVFGTTSAGGRHGAGTLFEITGVTSADFRTLHHFKGGTDGAAPAAGLLVDAGGAVFGTTQAGGTADAGTLFERDATGRYRVLHSLDGAAQGRGPQGGLAKDANGILYGTATTGGDPVADAGTVFSFDPITRTFAVLHTFDLADGAWPMATPLLDGSRLWGTGWGGTVFEMAPDGSNYARIGFSQTEDESIASGVAVDPSGNFWGTSDGGGLTGAGGIYEIDAHGKLSWVYTFDQGDFHDGKNPAGTLVVGRDGLLYGTTRWGGDAVCQCGSVFSFDPATATRASVHDFTDSDGAQPWAGLVQDASGVLYGVTQFGGAFGAGTVFRVTP
jgi:uncharacterized repeat protein (TIGR03803 family)